MSYELCMVASRPSATGLVQRRKTLSNGDLSLILHSVKISTLFKGKFWEMKTPKSGDFGERVIG